MRNILLYIGVAVVAVAIYGWYEFNRTVPTLEDAKADFTLAADELFDAFDSDEDGATAKYVGKVIEVSGTVIAIEVKTEGSTVTLEAANAMVGGVNCAFGAAPDLKEGQQLTLKCACQGFLMDVVMNNCNVVQQ
ncbi:MAG: hypothetical protein ACFCUH_05925 [Flavobacteriales bacterium]